MKVMVILPVEPGITGVPQPEAAAIHQALTDQGYRARLYESGNPDTFIIVIRFEDSDDPLQWLNAIERAAQQKTLIPLTFRLLSSRE